MPVSRPRDGITVDKLCHIENNLVLGHTGVTPHGLVLSLGNWSAMSTIRLVFLLLLFWRKSGYSDSKAFIPLSAHGLTSLPHPYRLHSYVLNTHHFPYVAKRQGLATLLLLCADISLNPGPISFGAVNCRSVRNKGPCINDTVSAHSVDILAVTETHIRLEDTDSLLHSITPTGFKFCHKPCIHGRGGIVGFFINKAIQFRSVDTPTFSTFENISIAIGSAAQPLVLTCVYRPPGSCSDSFLDQFLNLLEWGHGGRVVTLSPPTSAAGVRSPSWP